MTSARVLDGARRCLLRDVVERGDDHPQPLHERPQPLLLPGHAFIIGHAGKCAR